MYTTPRAGIGRAPEVTTRTQKLKATVCLAEDFPLNLQDQYGTYS